MSEEWVETTLGEIAEITIGKTPPRNEPKYWTTALDYPFCTIADIKDLDINPVREGVTEAAIDDKKAKRVPAGALLMSFKLSIGRIGFASRDIFPNEAIAWLNPKTEGTDKHYLGYWLSAQDLTTGSGRAVKGSTLNGPSLRAIKVIIPPLPVQRRIVDLMTHLDAHIANLQAERAAMGVLLNSTRDTLLTSEETWAEVPLIELTTKIGSGATPRGGESTYRTDGVALIRSQNIYDLLFEWEGLAHIGPEQSRLLDGVEVKPEDLLLSITGASVNRCCQVPSKVLPARVNQHVAILRCDPSLVFPRFLMHMLRRSDVKSALDTLAEAGTTRQALTKAQIEQFKVSIPDSKTQERSVLALDLLSSQLTMLNDEISCTEKMRTALIASLLSGKQRLDITYDPMMAKAI